MPFDLPLALIILFPLAGFAVCGLIGSRMSKPWPGIIASGTVLASFLVALTRVIGLAAMPENARTISETLQVPLIGIGSGPDCDGQILVCTDLLGLTPGYVPSFAQTFAAVGEETKKGFAAYAEADRKSVV